MKYGLRTKLLACSCIGVAVISNSSLGMAAVINSNAPSVTLTATLGESLTVSTGVSTVNFALVPGGTATGSAVVPITTSWTLLPTRTSVSLYAYFASSTSALHDSQTTPDTIPSADVLGQVTTGTPTAFTAFSQTSPFGGAAAGLTLFSQSISLSNVINLTGRTDNLSLEISLPAGAQIPAGSYTGTLTLQAQAQ